MRLSQCQRTAEPSRSLPLATRSQGPATSYSNTRSSCSRKASYYSFSVTAQYYMYLLVGTAVHVPSLSRGDLVPVGICTYCSRYLLVGTSAKIMKQLLYFPQILKKDTLQITIIHLVNEDIMENIMENIMSLTIAIFV